MREERRGEEKRRENERERAREIEREREDWQPGEGKSQVLLKLSHR